MSRLGPVGEHEDVGEVGEGAEGADHQGQGAVQGLVPLLGRLLLVGFYEE